MDKFPEIHNLHRFNHKELESLNKLIALSKLKQPPKTSQKIKVQDQMASLG